MSAGVWGGVHVGIVTYNSLGHLPACLGCLMAQTYSPRSITFFDNGSSDDVGSWLGTHFVDVGFIASSVNLGFGRGHNRIIESLDMDEGDYYLALNPDAYLTPTYIERLVMGLHHYGADWGMGKLLRGSDGTIYSVGHALLRHGYAFNIGYGMRDAALFSTSREVFGASGAAMMCRSSLIEGLKRTYGEVYDEAMFMYNEDVDFDWRARLAGYRCWYIADAVAYHEGGQADIFLQDEALANRFIMIIKNTCLEDLLLYHSFRLLFHSLVRLVITPCRGMFIIKKVLSCWGVTVEKRGKVPHGACGRMSGWFAWSGEQVTSSPTSYWQRVLMFLQK